MKRREFIPADPTINEPLPPDSSAIRPDDHTVAKRAGERDPVGLCAGILDVLRK